MPRTTGPTQRLRPASSQARAANFQAVSPRANANAAVYQPATHESSCCCIACAGLECLDRTRFFAGQLLTEADLNNEQSYWLAKGRLHNRFLHGWGVVCGLQVSCSDCDGWVTINPGYAIDPCGNDIIVCAGQSFNVLEAIQACCTPRQATDCSPLRYRPSPTCQDVIQTWCITIEYQEQPSRMVTPLQQSTSRNSGCGCGGNSGCGCGCSKQSASTQSGSSCSCASANASATTAACEPTRIIEGFKLGVCQAPSADTNQTGSYQGSPSGSQPGTYTSQFDQCYQPLNALILQRPTLLDASGKPMSDPLAYQATCQYLTSVKKALTSALVAHCQVETKLNAIQIPQPGGTNYNQLLQDKVKLMVEVVVVAALDCVCTSLLPPCPPDPCDKRLVLACVKVQDGSIIDIFHFGGGRRQVVTFPTLYYWLSLIGFDKALSNLTGFLELICCGDLNDQAQFFNSDYSQRESLATGGGNPAAFNQTMFTYVAQKLGAAMVNTVSTSAKAVDLRPLVGLDTEQALRMLGSYRIGANSIMQTDVSTDPSWTDAAITAAASYAPAAFNAGDPLTLYTRGKVVVGFEPTGPTDVLAAQVARLQQQVNDLSAQLNGVQTPASGANPGPKKK